MPAITLPSIGKKPWKSGWEIHITQHLLPSQLPGARQLVERVDVANSQALLGSSGAPGPGQVRRATREEEHLASGAAGGLGESQGTFKAPAAKKDCRASFSHDPGSQGPSLRAFGNGPACILALEFFLPQT